jgi:inorganic phosphate transporter, PiT family
MEHTILALAISTIAIVLIFEYTNGFHDAANIIATVIASRAMTPIQSVLLVATFEFLGPMLAGTAVADTIGGLVTLDDLDRVLALTIVLCGLVGAIAW